MGVIKVIPEFGEGATSCRGDMTGCAVCATGSTLIRYGLSIPRLDDGHPDMRTLGYRMGRLHRAAVVGNRHGLSLAGECSPPHHGTNWCGYCSYLYLRSRNLPAGYLHLTDSQILAHLKAGHALIVPGYYSRVPIVSENSYSSTVPARGRSDTGFGGSHMIAAFEVHMSGSTPTGVSLTDADFGSPSRPVVPPYSVWSWNTFLSFYHSANWGITYVNRDATPDVPPPPPAPSYTATVRPAGHKVYFYKVLTRADGSRIVAPLADGGRYLKTTSGFQAPCTQAIVVRWPDQGIRIELVKITKGGYSGVWVSSKWSNQP